MKNWSLLLVFLLCTTLVLVADHHFREKQQSGLVGFESREFQVGTVWKVQACKIEDGYRFELLLEDGRMVHVHLPVATKSEAYSFVTELFSRATPPRPTVRLLRNVGDYWIGELEVSVDGQTRNLLDLLKNKNLLLI